MKKIVELTDSILGDSCPNWRLLGFDESAKSFFLMNLAQSHQVHPDSTILVVCPSEEVADRLYRACHSILEKQDSCARFPLQKFWGRFTLLEQSSASRERLRALRMLTTKKSPLIFTTMLALNQMTLTPQDFRISTFDIQLDVELSVEILVKRLQNLGYQEVPRVQSPGEFVVRGGIADIFDPYFECPMRIEFIGDYIASIRFFDLENQASFEERKLVSIGPCCELFSLNDDWSNRAQRLHEYLLGQNIAKGDHQGMIDAVAEGLPFHGRNILGPVLRPSSSSLSRYLSSKILWCLTQPYEDLKNLSESQLNQFMKLYKQDIDRRKVTMHPDLWFAPISENIKAFLQEQSLFADCIEHDANFTETSSSGIVEFGNPDILDGCKSFVLAQSSFLPVFARDSSKTSSSFDDWLKYISHQVARGFRCIFVSISPQVISRFQHIVSSRFSMPVEALTLQGLESSSVSPGLYVLKADFAGYLLFENEFLEFIGSNYLFKETGAVNLSSKRRLKNLIKDRAELRLHDFVVHIQYGIGRYEGIKTMQVGDIQNDFVHLQFGGGDVLYLPVDRLGMLQKYTPGDSDSTPKLDRIQGKSWTKRKAAAKKAVHDLADKLVQMKASRKLSKGFLCHPPSELYYDFEGMFEFDETPDQLAAIQDINEDLSKDLPMDRLICGDVGFGKTEVALRAMMRVVLDGGQVLVIVPTTVLCFQHFHTFSKRFKEFGINIGMANRFVGKQLLRTNIEMFNKGSLDILVGTHRALSKDVVPSKLGLLVVDEEHRFGVAHKELIQSLGKGCHILTLTATPIPRTLHMAILGIRDLSIMASPPKHRKPVETYISPFDESLLIEAIQLEIDRGGQVYFIHNRIYDIESVSSRLNKLFPSARIKVAHGQLHSTNLEKIMLDFMNYEFDILCCTTIVESGLDIPNANTLIINNADHFGLAQLYQLRGRVGRSSRQSYCYLFYKDRSLSQESRKRLEAIGSHQDLGSGFQIANHDLEARGAGDLLGSSQSGFITSVGFEMYSKLLEDHILEANGERVEERFDPEIKLPIEALIPPNFVPSESERIKIYRQIFDIENREELEAYLLHINDCYGRLPLEVLRLFEIARIKVLLTALKADKLSANRIGFIELRFLPMSSESRSKILNLVEKSQEAFQAVAGPSLSIMLNIRLNDYPEKPDQCKLVEQIRIQISRLKSCLSGG